LSSLDPDLMASLRWALEPFPEEGAQLWRSVAADLGVVAGGDDALRSGSENVWLTLVGLSEARRQLEPLRSSHTREREVLAISLQLLDMHVGALQEVAGPEATVAVVSPYGLSPPDSWERLSRLLGGKDSWRTSSENSPDGVLLLTGAGVAAGSRFEHARLPDVTITLCYLLGLPTAQYMEGGLIVDAVDREFLETHPLRVVD
jgi:hypothetical protein